MSTKPTVFAHYSAPLCWVVSAIWLALAVLYFTGEGESAVLNGFLWLAGSVAFAVSAYSLSRYGKSDELPPAEGDEVGSQQ